MLITVKNANFSGSGLGKVRRLLHGVPQDALAGLWLCADSALGDPIAAVPDRSGGAYDAVVRAGWPSGIQRSYGLEVTTPAGTALRTTLPVNPPGRRVTVFVCGSNTIPGSEAGLYNSWAGSTSNTGMSTPAGSHGNAPALTLVYAGVDASPRWGVFDSSSDMIGMPTLSDPLIGLPAFGQPSVAAMDIDGVTGTVKLHVLGQPTRSVTDPRVSAFYDGVTNRGSVEIGIWPYAAVRSAAPSIGQLYMASAYYKTFGEAEAQSCMGFMRGVAETRGVTGF